MFKKVTGFLLVIGLFFQSALALDLSDLNPRKKAKLDAYYAKLQEQKKTKGASRSLASQEKPKISGNDLDPPQGQGENMLHTGRAYRNLATAPNSNVYMAGICRDQYGMFYASYQNPQGYESCVDAGTNNLNDQINSYQRGAGIGIFLGGN